jgi:TolB protein
MRHRCDYRSRVAVRASLCGSLALAGLVSLLAFGGHPVAQASGTWIAFSTERDGPAEVYVIRPDGTGLRNLTLHPALDVLPMWSPTRRQLAFWSRRDGEDAIYTMDLDGSNVRKLITVPPETYGWTWSPDGEHFAFSSDQGGDEDEIYVMDSDGGPWRNISKDPATLEYQPAWSPDSRRVAFVSNRDGPRRIYGVDADGRNAELLISPGGVEEYPAWSPDGRQLAFISRRRDLFHKDVWIADLGGANARNLTPPPDDEGRFDLTTDAWSPAWSPDGRRIAYIGDPFGDCDIFITNVEDPNRTRLAAHPARDVSPVWFDPRGLPVSSVNRRAATWGWLKALGRPAR